MRLPPWLPRRLRARGPTLPDSARQTLPGPPLPIETPEQFGAIVFGPILFAFMVWLMRHPATGRLDRIYFSAREGWLLEQLYTAMRAQSEGLRLPPGIYLHVSRRAVLAARMGADAIRAGRLDPAPLVECSPWFAGSVDELLLARIGFTPKTPAAKETARIVLMQDAAVVHCVADLLGPEILPHVRRACANFRAYADRCGLSEPGHAGLVDVGYSATIQSSIQKSLMRPLTGFYMAVTEKASIVGAEGGYAFGAFAQGPQAGGFSGEFGLHLEAVLTAPHGQVKSYADQSRGVIRRRTFPAHGEPQFDLPGAAQAEFAILERVHAGIIAYSLARQRASGLAADADPFAMLRLLRAGGFVVPAELRAALSVEDAFCGNGEVDVLGLDLGG